MIAIDAKKVANNKWEIFTHGGRSSTGIDAIEYAKIAEKMVLERFFLHRWIKMEQKQVMILN